jgi:hypothetical protein
MRAVLCLHTGGVRFGALLVQPRLCPLPERRPWPLVAAVELRCLFRALPTLNPLALLFRALPKLNPLALLFRAWFAEPAA